MPLESSDTLVDLRQISLPFDLDEVSEQCHKCVRKQLKKYEKFVDNDSKSTKDRFIVPCTGIPKEYINPSLKPMFPTEEAWEEAVSTLDIVKWVARNLKLPNGEYWIARWYQEEVLRCSSKRKVLRMARRIGKTDSVCVEICYRLFTESNIKIVVAGPQKSHTEEIITRVRAFIKNNSILSSMVTRDVSAPWYEILLSNGSRLRGFAAGTKGKGAGTGVRGQDADYLYIEEMDFVDENAIRGAVLPILQTTPDTALVGFSTPSGFQTPYYMLCEQSPNYIEFHYDYKVLSHWRNVEMERSAFTEEDWQHEFLASWGSSESGVYKPSYIDRALKVYKYSDISYSPMWRYCIGTDWNEKYGTELVVLGYDTATGRFQVVETVRVEGMEFTQLAGINRLLELNKKWKPVFIYIDSGNGSTNHELLRKTAMENRHPGGDRDTAKLLDILKKYDAGASISIKDPITSEESKVPAKAFMVNASIRMFEQNKISISSHDNILEKQLRNYIIERYTPTKAPVYGLENKQILDHRLDALNLAIVAFHLEFDDLHTVHVVTSVAAIPDPRTQSGYKNRMAQRDQEYNPEDRRLEGPLNKSSTYFRTPARLDNMRGTTKIDRPGWDYDREDERRAEWLQRRRTRARIQRDRPKRTTF